MPTCTAIIATTIDGKIALRPKHNSSWTSPEDKNFLHKILDKSNVVLVGNTTYKTAYKPLSKRSCIVLTTSVNTATKKNPRLLYCNPGKDDIKKIIRNLGYKSVVILGGSGCYTFCLKNNMIDEIYLTIEPLTFGTGLNMFASKKPLIKKFRLISTKRLNKTGSVLLHYKKTNLSSPS